MFSKVSIQNFGPFTDLTWDSRDRINLLIGANDTGKTYLLKILYCLVKSLEEYTKRQQSDQLDSQKFYLDPGLDLGRQG
jgi:AAA15 family ATPase/GTPase